MNSDALIRTPYHQLHISLVLRALDRKVYRDQFCVECGQPFIAISDKFVTILDSSMPLELMRTGDRVIEARCKRHTCKQYYRLWV